VRLSIFTLPTANSLYSSGLGGRRARARAGPCVWVSCPPYSFGTRHSSDCTSPSVSSASSSFSSSSTSAAATTTDSAAAAAASTSSLAGPRFYLSEVSGKVCTCVCARATARACTCACVCACVCVCVCACVRVRACVCVRACACVRVRACVRVYSCANVCVREYIVCMCGVCVPCVCLTLVECAFMDTSCVYVWWCCAFVYVWCMEPCVFLTIVTCFSQSCVVESSADCVCLTRSRVLL